MLKKDFMKDFEGAVLPDVEDREDCQHAWDNLIDTYIEDGILKESSRRWVNPYIKLFND